MKDNDIEILNFDDEVIYTKKEVIISKKVVVSNGVEEASVRKEKIEEVKTNDKKKHKEKRKYGIGEKLFLLISILFIIGCFIFYGYRTYHYYHATHDIVKNITLKEKLTALNNIAYQNDGLYEKTGYFYYKGTAVDNYVYFSGRLFRIIDINNGIRMVEEETETNLVWGIDSNYNDSYIHDWLNNYLKTIKDYDLYLDKYDWCNEAIELDNYSCGTIVNDYVGLLSTSDYLQAGGKSSYLNNETYFWTINQDKDGNVYYVNSEGSINNISKKEENYFSYGIRPVIVIKEDISIVTGSGTEEDPFIIEDLGNAMLRDNSVGNYVDYNGDMYRILKIDNDGVSLIYDGVLEIEKKYTDVYTYLNKELIKKYNKADLVRNTYYVNEYSFNNKYKLTNKTKNLNYVTIPSIGDLFLNEYDNYWLNDYSDSKLGLYYILDENKMFFADLKGNKHQIRPIITVNSETVVMEGIGTKEEPLVIGKEGDINVEKN